MAYVVKLWVHDKTMVGKAKWGQIMTFPIFNFGDLGDNNDQI